MSKNSTLQILFTVICILIASCKPSDSEPKVTVSAKEPVEVITFVDSKNTGYGRPNSLVFDKSDNLYFSDGFASIYKVTPDGKASLYAGNGLGYQDGPLTQAKFNRPNGLTFDDSGNLYFTEILSRCIRKITPDGQVSTFAGEPNDKANETGKDGIGKEARFIRPRGLTIDKMGNLYVTEGGYPSYGVYISSLRKIAPDARVATLAGFSGKISESVYESNSSFGEPNCIAIDKSGNLYMGGEGVIYKINPSGKSEIFSGKRNDIGTENGPKQSARYGSITSLIFDNYDNFYVGESHAGIIRKITPTGDVSNVTGTRFMGYKDGPLNTAEFISAESLAFDKAGNMYIADTGNSSIRKITFK